MLVLKLTPEGKRLATIGSTGEQDYQFNEPVSIDSDDIMYVADKVICHLVVFTTEEEYLGTLSLQHQNSVDIVNQQLKSLAWSLLLMACKSTP